MRKSPHKPDKPEKIGWLQAWSPRYLRQPSVIILLLANLIPLGGVLFWNWDLFTLMLLYWMETGVIGFWTIGHIALVARWTAVLTVPFFVVHFGGFMLGHLLFLWTMFGDPAAKQVQSPEEGLELVLSLVIDKGLWIALAALFVSHGLSFFFNVLRPWWRGEPQLLDEKNVMTAPYGRIIIMHLTILIGAALSALFQTRLAAFLLLMALKLLVDVPAHVRKNIKPDASPAPRLSTV